MSDFTAVRAVSVTLLTLLENDITNSTDPQLAGVNIHLESPRAMRVDSSTGISLWLYRVMREPDTLNRPLERVSPATLRHRPMPLTLHYLVSAIIDEPRDEQALLGKVVQIFHDHAIVTAAELRDTLEGEDQQLRLVFEALTLEELARVWDSLNEPYQLSLSYAVQVVAIDSDRDLALRPPVLKDIHEYHQIVEKPVS